MNRVQLILKLKELCLVDKVAYLNMSRSSLKQDEIDYILIMKHSLIEECDFISEIYKDYAGNSYVLWK